MFDSISALHYGTITLTTALPLIAATVSQSRLSAAVSDAVNRQPQAEPLIKRVYYTALFLMETSAIISIVMALILFFRLPSNYFDAIAETGIILAVGLTGFLVGGLSYLTALQAINAATRQPELGPKIVTLTLMLMSIMQSPIIFGLLVGLFIHNQAISLTGWGHTARLFAAGMTIGIGSIGPSIGLALFGSGTLNALARYKNSYNNLFAFAFVSQAMIEGPILFALIVSFILLFAVTLHPVEAIAVTRIIGGALSMSLSTLGAGLASGYVASRASQEIAAHPEVSSTLSRTSQIAQALIDTAPIYGLLIAMLLLFLR
jgi:F0F1-type ATP synthase membrane subunit c/vacuolar-type H+-ATPase subunit K